MEELAKKYGYASYKRIQELIEIYKNKEAILEQLQKEQYPMHRVISWSKALRVLKQLKQHSHNELYA